MAHTLRLGGASLLAALAIVHVGLSGACSNGSDPREDDGVALDSGADSHDPDTGSLGEGGGGGCPKHCSSDLHQVLDCDDHVIETCAEGLGCGGDLGCISA